MSIISTVTPKAASSKLADFFTQKAKPTDSLLTETKQVNGFVHKQMRACSNWSCSRVDSSASARLNTQPTRGIPAPMYFVQYMTKPDLPRHAHYSRD